MELREQQGLGNLWERVVHCGGLRLVNEKSVALRRYGLRSLFLRR